MEIEKKKDENRSPNAETLEASRETTLTLKFNK